MRHLIPTIFLSAGLLATAQADPVSAPPPPAAPRIATVDMQELFKQYHNTGEAQKQINTERARIQKDNNERLAKIRDIEAALGRLSKELEDPSVNESRKQALFKDWQSQQQEGIALDRERREFLQRRNQMLNEKMLQRMKGILEEIRKLVEEHAKTENFDYVLDKSGLSATQVPFLLYTKDATEITEVILKNLNKDAPDKAPAAPADPAPKTGNALVPQLEEPAGTIEVSGFEERTKPAPPPGQAAEKK